MKNKLLLILLFVSALCVAQTEKITKLLNKQFKAEQKYYEADDESKPTLVEPFSIRNDTLSFAFSLPGDEPGETQIIHRQVHLKDIEEFLKDINILFVTHKDAVRETHTVVNDKGEMLSSSEKFSYLFFTELSKDPYDGSLCSQMSVAFKKAGYKIVCEGWYN